MNRSCLLTLMWLLTSACGAAPESAPPATRRIQQQSTAGLASLKTALVPEPSNLWDFIRDKQAAIELGKAWFWDVQVSSDGKVACATCHHAAGVDHRTKNQIRPVGGSFFHGAPNGTVTAGEYPFHKLSDPDDPR